MVFRLPFTLLVVLFTLAGCASNPKVFSDFDSQQDFGHYRTFSWQQQPPGLVAGSYPVSHLTRQKIADAIKEEIIDKGFKFVRDKKDADFLIAFTLGARDKITSRSETVYRRDLNHWRWGRAYHPHLHRSRVPVTVEKPYRFTEGSIAIDVSDRVAKRPVWHANVAKRLNKKKAQKSDNTGAEIVASLLAYFPPNHNSH